MSDLIERRYDIAYEVMKENSRQDKKYGKERNQHYYTWMVILGAEYGEACQAALAFTGEDVDKGHHYREELIQVAAIAMAAIENYDRDKKRYYE